MNQLAETMKTVEGPLRRPWSQTIKGHFKDIVYIQIGH